MKDTLKLVFQDFAENTTAHAPPKILTHTHIISKLFWVLLFVTGLGAFVYFSQELIASYLDYDTTTDIELKFNVLEFPAVTVCNQNQFRADRVPKDIGNLVSDFLMSKREEMFGGKAMFKKHQGREGRSGGGSGGGDGDGGGGSDGPEGDNEQPPPATAAAGAGSGTTASACGSETEGSQVGAVNTAAGGSEPGGTTASGGGIQPGATTAAAAGTQSIVATTAGGGTQAGATTAAAAGAQSIVTTTAGGGTQAAVTTAAASGPQTTNAPAGTNSVDDAATTSSTNSTAAAVAANGTAAATGTPLPPAGPGKRRRRRAVEYSLNDKERTIMDDMIGFYTKPNMADLANMTWFENVGNTSSEKMILYNLTQYISQFQQRDLMAAGHDIQEMLQECVFMGKTCGPQDFDHFYDMKYGNCYTFNSGMSGYVARITNPGASFGLSLTMFVNQNEYIPVLTQEAGLRVNLHRQGQVPIMEEDGFDTTPGTKSGIAVRYVEISRLDGLYSNCTTETNRTGTHEYYPGNYTQKACLKTCLQKGIIEACKCANPLYRHFKDVPTCGPNDTTCVEEEELRLLDNNICSSQCPTPCWESQYQYVISTSQWPSNNYMPFLKESLDERGDSMKNIMGSDPRTGLSQQFLKLAVYYDNLNYYKYTERPTMTFKDLIGAIGGHLGLWIGMSVVSFVEVFELILTLFKWCAYKVHNNKTNSMTDLGYDEREKVNTPVHSIRDGWINGKDN